MSAAGVPRAMGSVYGVETGPFGSVMSIPQNAFSVGGAAMPGLEIFSGVTATGKRESEKLVQSQYATIQWRESHFEKSQAQGQYLFSLRAGSQNREQLSMLTNFQLNSLMRGVHERLKQITIRTNGGPGGSAGISADDYDQIDELLLQLKERGSDIVSSVAPDGRLSDEARERMAHYLTAGGICSLYNYLGVYANDGGREMRNFYMINVGFQGPCYAADIFQPLSEDSDGADIALGPAISANDYCRFILRRRFSHATQQYEEFVVEPHSSAERFAPSEAREYEDPASDRVEFGPTFHVGRVLDVMPQKPDPKLLVRMRGISNTWEDAFQAHGASQARLKLALGHDAWSVAA